MAVERIYPNYRPDEWQEPQLEPKKKKVTRTKVVGISRIEKVVYISLITMIALISIYMLSLKMDAYNNKTQIAELDSKIEQQQTTNSDLKTESMKQSSYERIYEKAEDYGLKLNNDNVKVVRSDAKN
ncbi:cell division protein FtsL [Mammaliicoccus vitulinus]|uniref:Cell division protein FtsL n=1 Tax=Mammaliicoccus vitulinus TaxID=71237 RepID=A0A2T4PS12_9STAP|nr:cell division protein FtsL [Mammaliicoccus vitulinus]HAL08994.1 cell division protein FtsL [Staphylococcus sp.]MBM6628745.1 cell division protein FtsL [Mammaliicoccus vitulinus]MBO3076778.1 cell division protein FtsL [Mammaliicoccus vitulinus]MEB7656451.1 cell division protein FtsL [Mammaliicoccus vitulinus]PNZ40403.1 cell division protein FtsL [Mammaliicoccus vitulinus]